MTEEVACITDPIFIGKLENGSLVPEDLVSDSEPEYISTSEEELDLVKKPTVSPAKFLLDSMADFNTLRKDSQDYGKQVTTTQSS
jgi:hypothetical protein